MANMKDWRPVKESQKLDCTHKTGDKFDCHSVACWASRTNPYDGAALCAKHGPKPPFSAFGS